MWWAAWIAPAPLLWAVRGCGWRATSLLGALAGLIASVSLFGYLVDLSGVVDAAGLSLVRAAQWSLFALAWRLLTLGVRAWAAVVALPALVAGSDVWIAAVSPHGSAGSLAYSQVDVLPIAQLASLGGVAAITFVLVACATALAHLADARRVTVALLIPAVVLVASLGFGAARLGSAPAATQASVAVISSDRFEGSPDDWRAVWSHYEPAIVSAAAEGVDVVVLPEKLWTIADADVADFTAVLSDAAQSHGVSIVLSVDQRGETDVNRLYLFAADGGITTYDKRHLVPGWEGRFTPGTESVTVSTAGLTLALAICKDLDFPATFDPGDADLIVVPAWDFGQDAGFHARMAILRGIEQGIPVARSARDGLVTLTDPYGQHVVPAMPSQSDPVIAIGGVPAPVPTLYGTIGDAFGWIAGGASVLVLIWLFVRARRLRAANDPRRRAHTGAAVA